MEAQEAIKYRTILFGIVSSIKTIINNNKPFNLFKFYLSITEHVLLDYYYNKILSEFSIKMEKIDSDTEKIKIFMKFVGCDKGVNLSLTLNLKELRVTDFSYPKDEI